MFLLFIYLFIFYLCPSVCPSYDRSIINKQDYDLGRKGVQESTPAGVSVFQQDPEQDQEWIFLTGIGAGAGVIYNHSVYEIILSICTVRDL